MEQLVIVCTHDGQLTYTNPMWKQTSGNDSKNIFDIIKSSGSHFLKNFKPPIFPKQLSKSKLQRMHEKKH